LILCDDDHYLGNIPCVYRNSLKAPFARIIIEKQFKHGQAQQVVVVVVVVVVTVVNVVVVVVVVAAAAAAA